MAKNYLRLLLVFVMAVLMVGCATQKHEASFQAYDLNPKLQAGQLVQKVDNFMVILDASTSMNGSCGGQNKLYLAKDIVSRMNQTIPALEIVGALRTFGQAYSLFHNKTTLVYGLTGYCRAGLDEAIRSVGKAVGKSPLDLAIDAGSEDLKSTEGQIAVIIVSDGEDMDDAPVLAAERMKRQYGDRVCIYTVLVGAGKGLMEQIAQAGGCGFSVSAGDIASSQDMAHFVEKVFFAEVTKAADSDGDGVPDDLDQCPDTPRGVKVDARGCPLDTDGDGVPDYLDQCPDTPKGASVNSVGCWTLQGMVLFDHNKWELKPAAYPFLDEVVAIMKQNPDLSGVIEGHTDSTGSEAYNQRLSEKRAQAVEAYIESQGIDPARFSVIGYGESKPIASNDTAEGRQENRRVQLRPSSH